MKNDSCYRVFWTVSGSPVLQELDGTPVFSVRYDKCTLSVALRWSVNEEPLTLTASALPGDAAELVIRPYRLELLVNGALADEEWPYGEPLFDILTVRGVLALSVPPEVPADEPSVTRSFTGAEAMRIPGVNIGDCMPYSDPDDDSLYHLFWLYDRHRHHSKWWLGAHQWAHCSTRDLLHWDAHPMAIPVDDPMEGSICTGSVIRSGGTWYAWYAQRMSDRSPARMTCAVSKDGYHFTKRGTYFSVPDAYEKTTARDPKVVKWDGMFHMLVTTTEVSSGRGCLAHLVSADMENWADAGVLFRYPGAAQPECPDWFEWNGKFYLLTGIGGTAYYMVSDEPFSGWEMPSADPARAIPCGRVPKSAMLNGRRIFMGFDDGGNLEYAGSLMAVEAFQNPDGTLRFEHLIP